MGAMARATVSHGESQATIEEGQRVRIGRSTVCDVQVGSGADGGPEDLGVSRTAATVSMQDGRLWVRNDSASQPVYLVPETGPTRVLENQDEIASLPIDRVTVQLRGRIRTHDVTVELEQSPPLGDTRPIPTDGPATQYLLEFTNAERRILTALCEPLLTKSGDQSKPASYAQAAERLFLSRSRVENCIADLVKKYASAGVPGLEGPEAKDNLCRYAVRSGSISATDLEHIP
jgi:hypothetical protein